MSETPRNPENCKATMEGVRDALYAISGKWKLMVMVAMLDGANRFNEIERAIDGITPKVLSKELKDMELNGFLQRVEIAGSPTQVIYELTPYSSSLSEIVRLLGAWGTQHRKHIMEMSKELNAAKA